MAGETILVIEDNALNMKLVRSLLEIGKYCIIEAEDAERGIQLARERKPDLILMDIQLPGMDGLTATGILKSDAAVQGIAIVALTSHAMEGDDKKALEAGCDGYITKPINTKKFLPAIGKYFNG
jgi:CheY-like chemotaxis protein